MSAQLESVDVAVIGSGPGGAVAAALLADRGLDVLMVEREPFPRFHIGESLTGSAGNIVRDLGLADQMRENEYPEKPGVTVIGRDARNEFFVPVLNPTWQVRRSTFDAMLRDRALAAGVRPIAGQVVDVLRDADRVSGLRYRPADGAERSVRARVVLDASGQSALLSRLRVAGARNIQSFSNQIAFFTHFERLPRDPGPFANNTSIYYSHAHHWAWVIPISPTVDSVGIVIPRDVYRANCDSPEGALVWGIDEINPALRERAAKAIRVEPVRACRDYSYRIDPFAGEGWACVGDSHRFIDPIFSFGVSFAMTEAARLAEIVPEAIERGTTRDAFRAYGAWSDVGQGVATDLIRYFWKYPVFFGYQMQNATTRREVIRLFGGECFAPGNMRAPAVFRAALEKEEAAAA